MEDFLGAALFLMFQLAAFVLPLLVLAWFVRTLAQMRRDQARLLALVASIEAELRARGDRERWG